MLILNFFPMVCFSRLGTSVFEFAKLVVFNNRAVGLNTFIDGSIRNSVKVRIQLALISSLIMKRSLNIINCSSNLINSTVWLLGNNLPLFCGFSLLHQLWLKIHPWSIIKRLISWYIFNIMNLSVHQPLWGQWRIWYIILRIIVQRVVIQLSKNWLPFNLTVAIDHRLIIIGIHPVFSYRLYGRFNILDFLLCLGYL